MKKMLLLGLMLWGNAGAVTLYTVTVKTVHAVQRVTISAIPLGSGKIQFKNGDWVTFKLPAGKYTFMAVDNGNQTPDFTAKEAFATINKNTVVWIPVEYTGNF